MKPPKTPLKRETLISPLCCRCLLALMLFWQSPTFVGAQVAGTNAYKGDSSGNIKVNASASTKPEAESTSQINVTDSTKASVENKKDSGAKDEKSSDEIQVSFQGANIEMIAQWLAQTSGKSVLKHPRAQCQLTIIGSKKVTKREALNLVYRALALEGFTAIESSKAILIVPEGQEPKMSPELIGASKNDIPEGRQKLVKIFSLKHSQANDVKEKVKSLLSEKATIDVDE